jgi:hypothetical protein
VASAPASERLTGDAEHLRCVGCFDHFFLHNHTRLTLFRSGISPIRRKQKARTGTLGASPIRAQCF